MIDYVEVATQSLKCTQVALAKKLGVHRAVLTAWKKRKSIPLKMVKQFSDVTGIPCYVLSPKYFPAPKMSQRPENGTIPQD